MKLRLMKKMPVWLVILLCAGLGLRLALPQIVKWKINKTLEQLPDYQGHVGGVHLALWRAGCSLHDVQIEHRAGDLGLTIKQFSFQISWLELFKRVLMADVKIVSPRLRILVSKPLQSPKKVVRTAQDVNKHVVQKTGETLPDVLAGLMPFQIREFRLIDGTIRIQDDDQNLDTLQEKDKAAPKQSTEASAKEKALEARMTHLEIEGHNLTNAAELSGSSYASGQVEAQIMDSGHLKIDLKFNPIAKTPAFNINIMLTQIALPELNPMFRWQWGVDVATGTFAMFAEAAAKDGEFKGYVKPFIHGLKMHSSDPNARQNLGARIKEAVVDVTAAILKNSKTKNVANKVPFEGRFDNPHIGIWDAVVTVLRNAFVKALTPRLDKTINVTNLHGEVAFNNQAAV